jgi:hypothetical protein
MLSSLKLTRGYTKLFFKTTAKVQGIVKTDHNRNL